MEFRQHHAVHLVANVLRHQQGAYSNCVGRCHAPIVSRCAGGCNRGEPHSNILKGLEVLQYPPRFFFFGIGGQRFCFSTRKCFTTQHKLKVLLRVNRELLRSTTPTANILKGYRGGRYPPRLFKKVGGRLGSKRLTRP